MLSHTPSSIGRSKRLYTNLEIGDIVRKYRIIDLQTLMKITGKRKKSVIRQINGYQKRNQIVKIKKGKYTLYVWNSFDNPFIKNKNLLFNFHRDYCWKFFKWYILGIILGKGFLDRKMKLMNKRLEDLRKNDTEFDKSITSYTHKMFFKGYGRRL